MLEYLADYTKDGEFEKYLNHSLMNKEPDTPLVEVIKEAWKSLEVIPSIHIVSFDYTEEESKIDINNHIFKREKRKKKGERFDYKYVNDDRCGKLTVKIEVTIKEKDPETGKIVSHVYPFTKAMLIPKYDKDGYLYIKGKKYRMIYQMVEKSTYTTSQTVKLKSLMPISVRRVAVNVSSTVAPNTVSIEVQSAADIISHLDPDSQVGGQEVEVGDVTGKNYHVPVYYILIFKKEVAVVLLYMSHGIRQALAELQVQDVITCLDRFPLHPREDCIYFKISNKCYLEVLEWAFRKYSYVQSVVGGIMTVTTNRTTIEQLEDGKQWVKRLVNPANYERGLGTLKNFNRLLDETTKRILFLYDYHKKDIYTLVRWICQEYNMLRLKDNLSLDNKRLRCNEVIASLFTKELSNRLRRIMTLGENATVKNYQEFFKWSGDMLITTLFNSGILAFDDSNNDMDFFKQFKYTTKGPQSLGNKNGNNVGSRYRSIHPSFIGNIDVLVCGNSDPGRNGLLSPWGKINGFYFDDSVEVGNFLWNLQNDLKEYYGKKGKFYITLQFDKEEDYYKTLCELQKMNDGITCYGTSKEGAMEVIIDTTDYFNDENGAQSKAETKEKPAPKATSKSKK